MKRFTFQFIVSGKNLGEESLARLLQEAGCDDVSLRSAHHLLLIGFDREADTYAEAALSAYSDLLRTRVMIERFEPDFLVDREDIATRGGLSREAVDQFLSVADETDFPKPHARITSPDPLWDWAEVSTFLHTQGLLTEEHVHAAHVSRAINWHLQTGWAIPATEKQLLEQMQHIGFETALRARII